MGGLNPTVTGALIAVGATLIGFVVSSWTTHVTVRANRRVARDERLWDQKTALYQEILRAIDLDPLMPVQKHDLRVAIYTMESLGDRALMYASDKVNHYMTRFEVYSGGVDSYEGRSPYDEELATTIVHIRQAIRADLQESNDPEWIPPHKRRRPPRVKPDRVIQLGPTSPLKGSVPDTPEPQVVQEVPPPSPDP